MDEFVFKIVQLVVIIVAGLIGRYLIPWIKTKIEMNKLEESLKWIEAFVKAAQQTIKGEKVNEEKFEKVLQWTKEKLDEIGVEMTEEQIRALIESSVYEMKDSAKEK